MGLRLDLVHTPKELTEVTQNVVVEVHPNDLGLDPLVVTEVEDAWEVARGP